MFTDQQYKYITTLQKGLLFFIILQKKLFGQNVEIIQVVGVRYQNKPNHSMKSNLKKASDNLF